MTFGLKDTPGTIDAILSSLRWQHALLYLDDLEIFSKTPEDHIYHARYVGSLIQQSGVAITLRKCVFFPVTIDYLGHIIRPRKLQVSETWRKAIERNNLPVPLRNCVALPCLMQCVTVVHPKLSKSGRPTQLHVTKGPTISFLTSVRRSARRAGHPPEVTHDATGPTPCRG